MAQGGPQAFENRFHRQRPNRTCKGTSVDPRQRSAKNSAPFQSASKFPGTRPSCTERLDSSGRLGPLRDLILASSVSLLVTVLPHLHLSCRDQLKMSCHLQNICPSAHFPTLLFSFTSSRRPRQFADLDGREQARQWYLSRYKDPLSTHSVPRGWFGD